MPAGDALLRWAGKGFWAVIDQGLFSSANLLVNILLARWLAPEEYGAFAVAFSIYYLLMNFHTAVLTEPMLVFGAGKYREQFPKYLGMLIYGHWGLSAVIALLLAVAALLMQSFGSKPMAQALAGLAIASPFLLLLWLTRRASYVETQPQWAALSSGINLVATLAGLFLLWRAGLLSSLSGLALLGVAAIIASLVLLTLHLHPLVWVYAGNPTPAMVLADHWTYGSWNLLGVLAYWASGQILILLIPVFLGLAASAAIAAIWNLYRPVSLFMQSLGLVILPIFSRWVNEGRKGKELRYRAVRLALLVGGAVALYGSLLTIMAKPLLHLLYAGKYDEHWVLVGLSCVPWMAAMSLYMLALGLKSVGRVREASLLWASSAMFVVLVGKPALEFWGLKGALVVLGISYSFALLIGFLLFRRSDTANTKKKDAFATEDYSQRFLGESAVLHYVSMYDNPNSFDTIIWDLEKEIISGLIDRHIGYTGGKSLLDFACGSGRILSFLEARFHIAVGIDISPEMAKVASARLQYANVIVGDVTINSELLPGPFNVITAFRFMLNADPLLREQALLALGRRMDGSSVLIVNVHGHAPSLRSLAIRLKRVLLKASERDVNEMGQREFIRLVQKARLSVVDKIGVALLTPKIAAILGTRLTKFIERLSYRIGLSRYFGSNQIYVLRLAYADIPPIRFLKRRSSWFSQHKDDALSWLSSSVGITIHSGRYTHAILQLPDGRGYLLLLENARVFRSCLNLYAAQTVKARVAKRALKVLSSLGLKGPGLPRIRVEEKDSHDGVLQTLREVFGQKDLVFAVSLNMPGPYRKPVLQVMTSSGKVLGYAKVGWNAITKKLVQNETLALRQLSQQGLKGIVFPEILYVGQSSERFVMVTKPLGRPKARLNKRAFESKLLQTLTEIANQDHVVGRFADSIFWSTIKSRADRLQGYISCYERMVLERVLRVLEEHLADVNLPWTWRLGDVTPWNAWIDEKGERLFVTDLENATAYWLSGWDFFHFARMTARSASPELNVDECLKMITQYYSAFGVSSEHLLFLYLAYLVDLFTEWVEDWKNYGEPPGEFDVQTLHKVETEILSILTRCL